MEVSSEIANIVSAYLNYLTWPIFWLIAFFKSHQKLPPIKDYLLMKSATSLAKAIRTRQESCEKVVQAYINRIKIVNPILNAIVQERFEDALQEAKEVDAYLSTLSQEEVAKLENDKPLLGVPVTIKETCSLKGMSLTAGSLTRVGIKASEDGVAVSRLRAAGAIPLLVSTTPEMCLCWQTKNLITGVTYNPYDTTRTPGGSSGGEGALISSGGSVIGLGSDIAGSIRIPALFCGIFGHKPTPGLVPLKGHMPDKPENEYFQFCLTLGPMTRYSEDLEPMLKIISGDNFNELKPEENINLSKIKVFYLFKANEDLILLNTQRSIKNAIRKAIVYLKEDCKMEVEQANFNLSCVLEMTSSLYTDVGDIAMLLTDTITGKDKNVYIEMLKALFGRSEYSMSALEYYFIQNLNEIVTRDRKDEYKKKALELKDEIIRSLGDDGVLILPTLPESAPYHNQVSFKTLQLLCTTLFNVLGLPSTHVPMGLDDRGLPIGFQVIAAPYRDRLCLAVARKLEKAFGGWTPPS